MKLRSASVQIPVDSCDAIPLNGISNKVFIASFMKVIMLHIEVITVKYVNDIFIHFPHEQKYIYIFIYDKSLKYRFQSQLLFRFIYFTLTYEFTIAGMSNTSGLLWSNSYLGLFNFEATFQNDI